jgi:acyl homoserine lactone synthase
MRARVFKDRLNWDVAVENGRERDSYDDLNPAYVVSIDEPTGRVRGSVRILPTTGRHMMRDIFNSLFDEPLEIQSPVIWECTRFCIHPDFDRHVTPTGLNVATCEILQGICDTALRAGVKQILGVSEIGMLRIYRRSGWSPEIVGRAVPPFTAPIFAGLWDVSTEVSRTIAARAGLADRAHVEPLAA